METNQLGTQKHTDTERKERTSADREQQQQPQQLMMMTDWMRLTSLASILCHRNPGVSEAVGSLHQNRNQEQDCVGRQTEAGMNKFKDRKARRQDRHARMLGG